MYWRRPTAAEVGDMGLRPEDYPEPEIEVWDENWSAIELFQRHSTQWRVGMNGPIGLDYSVVEGDLLRRNVLDSEFEEMMRRIRVIERAALDCIHKG